MRIKLIPHSIDPDMREIVVSVHPVTGQADKRVGYANIANGSWSLIAQHGFSMQNGTPIESLLQQLDTLVDEAIREFADAATNP